MGSRLLLLLGSASFSASGLDCFEGNVFSFSIPRTSLNIEFQVNLVPLWPVDKTHPDVPCSPDWKSPSLDRDPEAPSQAVKHPIAFPAGPSSVAVTAPTVTMEGPPLSLSSVHHHYPIQ